jgi:hypothetical protein
MFFVVKEKGPGRDFEVERLPSKQELDREPKVLRRGFGLLIIILLPNHYSTIITELNINPVASRIPYNTAIGSQSQPHSCDSVGILHKCRDHTTSFFFKKTILSRRI